MNEYVRLFDQQSFVYEELLAYSDQDLESLFSKESTLDTERYSKLSEQFGYFRDELQKPGCTRQVLWQRYIENNPDGYRRSQFNDHLRRWLKETKTSGKLHHKAGDNLYVDYTGKKLSYTDRTTCQKIEVEVFVGILPCSQLTYVEASRSQQRGDFLESVANCLQYMGGVPQAIVPDNLKSAVTKASKYEPTLNKTFKDFGLHYGCVINPTRAYSPQDKALVEGAVRLVYQRIFYPLNEMTFFSLADLNAALSEQLKSYNTQLLTTTEVSRRHQFDTLERAFLSPLPAQPYELKTYKRVTVQKIGYIYVSEDKNYYSVPVRYIHKKVELCYNRHIVEVYYKHERISVHARSHQSGAYITIDEHKSSSHQYYQKWSPEFFADLARPHGWDVACYVAKLIDQSNHPQLGYKQSQGIIKLAKEHGSDRLNKACKRAISLPQLSYKILKTILENGVEDNPLEEPQFNKSHIPQHDNVRGVNYYSHRAQC